jgi:CHAT domain-containing protein
MKSLLFLFFLIAHLVVGQSTCEQMNEKAISSYETGSYGQAVQDYRNASSCFLSKGNDKAFVASQFCVAQTWIRLEQNIEAQSVLTDLEGFMSIKGLLVDSNNVRWLNTFGESELRLGHVKSALDLVKKSLEIAQKSRNIHPVLQAQTCNMLGLIYWSLNNLEESTTYLQTALDLRLKFFGDLHSETAGSYNNLGLVFAEENPTKSLEYYRKALSIYLDMYGKNHPATASCLNNIALINSKLKKYDAANQELASVLAIRKTLFGDKHPSVAFTLSSIGALLVQQNQWDAAVAKYQEALRIYQLQYGSKHPEIAGCYNQIGSLLIKKKYFKQAISTFDSAVYANTFSSIDILNSYYNPLILLSSLVLKSEAYEQLYKERTMAVKHLKMSLLLLQQSDTLLAAFRNSRSNQKDRIALGEVASQIYPNAVRVSYLLYQLQYQNKYKQLMFAYVEKNKGSVLQQAIAESNALQFANLTSEVLTEEKRLRTQIASIELLMSQNMDEKKASEVRLKMLKANQDLVDFVKSLEAKYPDYYNLKYNATQLGLRQFQDLLPANTMVHTTLYDEQTSQLYVFTVQKQRFQISVATVQPVFWKNIIALRNLSQYSDSASFVPISYALHQKLFPNPIPKNIDKLIVLPEGRLATIPFDILLSQKPTMGQDEKHWKYIGAQLPISYTYSFELLAQRLKKPMDISANILLAAPVEFEQEKTLLGSEAEVKNIQVLFGENGKSNRLLLKQEASETAFKQLTMQQYGILHLATHGVVDESNPEMSKVFLSPEKQEDGNLYCGEIYNLKLHANLVTLSACETGLGKLAKGEGMLGLSRALLYAGASNIIVSLWKVSDQSTSRLMQLFYIQMIKSNDISQSLFLAKKQLLSELPSSQSRSSIYYWSPFVLIGY